MQIYRLNRLNNLPPTEAPAPKMTATLGSSKQMMPLTKSPLDETSAVQHIEMKTVRGNMASSCNIHLPPEHTTPAFLVPAPVHARASNIPGSAGDLVAGSFPNPKLPLPGSQPKCVKQ
jgi:hypothetical protein